MNSRTRASQDNMFSGNSLYGNLMTNTDINIEKPKSSMHILSGNDNVFGNASNFYKDASKEVLAQ